jgi:hypothetical protein
MKPFVQISKAVAYFFQVERARVDLEANILQENPTFRRQTAAVGPPREAQFEAMVSLEYSTRLLY